MTGIEMVVALVALSCVAGIANTWLKTRGKASDEDADRRVDGRTLDELQRRVEVLEKIVTDRQYDLKEQIRRL